MRRRRPERRQIIPDPVYSDLIVAKFVNNLMLDGKKSTAEKLFYKSLEIIKNKEKKDGLEIFRKALQNVSPVVEVKSKRIGGATYQVPTEVRENRRSALAMRWLIQYSRARKGQTMADRLAAEFIAASKGEGSSFKKKEDTHRMAEANKAFAHFR
ncbi:MAG: 30S ribosomal protein S7 [Candidatus Marinimicrobia bacterium]|nr:30S ribosomal protein S7 [Candidatus Neomarinimicrobiota bacterium]MAJ45668.1 30S ribosomal protein S7 [Candidatus Neomarinimicrobiota bacterium]|tara:strand:+ start:514 stop:978 length:465 start_codon:yes stop_codon:yes gene_type:complete